MVEEGKHGASILLTYQCDLPTDEGLSTVFKLRKSVGQSALTTRHKDQIESWVKQGIQVSTIHAALQRQCGFNESGVFTIFLEKP